MAVITISDRDKLKEKVDEFIASIEKNDKSTITLTITAKQGKIVGKGVSVNDAW